MVVTHCVECCSMRCHFFSSCLFGYVAILNNGFQWVSMFHDGCFEVCVIVMVSVAPLWEHFFLYRRDTSADLNGRVFICFCLWPRCAWIERLVLHTYVNEVRMRMKCVPSHWGTSEAWRSWVTALHVCLLVYLVWSLRREKWRSMLLQSKCQCVLCWCGIADVKTALCEGR